jgi:hypothetical protein
MMNPPKIRKALPRVFVAAVYDCRIGGPSRRSQRRRHSNRAERERGGTLVSTVKDTGEQSHQSDNTSRLRANTGHENRDTCFDIEGTGQIDWRNIAWRFSISYESFASHTLLARCQGFS